MKHNPTATANALATTTGILFIACRILVGLLPDLMFSIAQSWLHGIELTKLGTWNPTLSTFFLGLISSAATAWLIGYVFANAHNYFNRR